MGLWNSYTCTLLSTSVNSLPPPIRWMCCYKIKLHLECISQHAIASLLCSDAKEYQSWINSYNLQCCNKLQMDSIIHSMLQSRTQRLKTKPHITRGHTLSQIYVHLQCLGSIKNAHLALYERKQWVTFYISPWRVMINALSLPLHMQIWNTIEQIFDSISHETSFDFNQMGFYTVTEIMC